MSNLWHRFAGEGLGTRRYQGTLLLLCVAIAAWGQVVSHPQMLVDLSGAWDACPVTHEASSEANCRWRKAQVPAHFVANPGEQFEHHIRFRKFFEAPATCLEHTCKLIMGEVGDSASVQINGALIRQATPAGVAPVYEKNYPVGVDLPPILLRPEGQENELVVTIYSFRDQQVGLRAGPVGITTNSVGAGFLQWRSFRNVFLPLTCSIVGAVVVLLIGFMRRSGVPVPLWRAFYRHATASAIFMFSFSEIPRQFAPLVYVVPGHFLLRFYTDYALIDLFRSFYRPTSCGLWRVAAVFYKICFAAFTALLLVGVYTSIFGVHLFDASTTFSFVLLAYPLTTLMPILMAARALQQKQWAFAGWLFVTAGFILHEWAIGSGFYDGEFVSKYAHLIVTVGFLVALVQRAARAQASEVAALSAEKEIAQLARQMDHDIRSPLAALDLAVRQLDTVPENLRVLIRMAVERIRDIANSLRHRPGVAAGLTAGATAKTTAGATDETTAGAAGVAAGHGTTRHPILLTSMVDAVVSEKRMQYSNNMQLEIEQQLSASSYDLFVSGDAGPLKRVISNLINNAAEAMAMRGRVRVAVRRDGELARIVISDQGPGMPSAILARLGEKGLTFAKPGGSGLGIHHAMQTAGALGGSVTFAVPASGGTQATVALPRCEAPAWFARRVVLDAQQTVVILDDDRAVHAAWRERLHPARITLIHLSSQSQLEQWVAEAGAAALDATYFVDYELAGSADHGLNMIINMRLQQNAFLVTSHFETPDVLDRCLAHKVLMIPKSLVDIVPIKGSAVSSAA